MMILGLDLAMGLKSTLGYEHAKWDYFKVDCALTAIKSASNKLAPGLCRTPSLQSPTQTTNDNHLYGPEQLTL